jgi:hypothetical protein
VQRDTIRKAARGTWYEALMSDAQMKDYKALLTASFDLLNTLDGKPFPNGRHYLNDAQTLAKKIVMHLETVYGLLTAGPRPDQVSIAVLCRSAYEALLLLHYLFIDPVAESEKRYQRWKLDGLRRRARVRGFRDPRPADRIAAGARVIADLEEEIRTAVVGGKISVNRVLRKITESWRPTWSALATLAGLQTDRAEGIYAWLCAYAHGDSWAVLQIDQSARNGDEQQFCDTFGSIACALLALLIEAYPRVMPVDASVLGPDARTRASRYAAFLRESQ